ncbi:MAG: AAA family ATPase [Limisphaerales bacterium]
MNPNTLTTTSKSAVPFYQVIIDQSPATYERNLIISLLQSHYFYLSVRADLCPWNGNVKIRRADFSVPQYNTLFEAIAFYWDQIEGSISEEAIPPQQLESIIVDWNNSLRIATTEAEKIVEEIREDLYSIPVPESFVEDAMLGKSFAYWLEQGLSKKALDEIINKSRTSQHLSMDSIERIIESYKSQRVANAEASTLWAISEATDLEPNEGELLKHRYLCEGGALLLVGPTGVGKSTFGVQLMTQFALGRSAFGIEPSSVLTSLVIQAENDHHDIADMFNGVAAGLDLNGAQKRTAGQNIVFVHESSRTGADLCAGIRRYLQMYEPDLLWIDPALAYIGGDSNSQRDVGSFLRNQINPLIREFECGCVLLHHTNKPSTSKDGQNQWRGSDFAYSGSGSAEWTNWARAVLVLHNRGDGVFELQAAKRGKRLGWKDADGSSITSRMIAHSKVPGQLFWRDAEPDECLPHSEAGKAATVISLVPTGGSIEKKALLHACQVNGVSDKPARSILSDLVVKKILEEHTEKRPGVRDAVLIRRPVTTTEVQASVVQPVIVEQEQ